MTDVKPTSDASKDATQKAASAETDHKLVADSGAHAKPADKPAETKSAQHSGWDIGSLVSSAINGAEAALSTAAAFLPPVSVAVAATEAVAKAAQAVGQKNADQTSKPAPAADQAHKPAPAADQTHKPAGNDHKAGEARPADSKAPVSTISTDAKGPAMSLSGLSNLPKLDIDFHNSDMNIDNLLKAKGCDSISKSCPTAPVKPLVLDGFSFGDKAKTVVNNNKAESKGQHLIGNEAIQNAFDIFTQQTGKKVELELGNTTAKGVDIPVSGKSHVADSKPVDSKESASRPDVCSTGNAAACAADLAAHDKGRLVRGPEGYTHLGADGKPDFERKGDKSIRQNADGTRDELDTRSGVQTEYGKDGKVRFRRLTDGTYEVPGKDANSKILIAPDGKSARFRTGDEEYKVDIVDGKLVPAGDRKLITAPDGGIPAGADLLAMANNVISGKHEVKVWRNGMQIIGDNGMFIAVKRDGTATMSLDQHSWIVLTKERTIEIRHNDGRQDEILTEEQAKKMFADPNVSGPLRKAFESLRNYKNTGRLAAAGADPTAPGDSIAQVAGGKLLGVTATETRELDPSGQYVVTHPGSKVREVHSADGKHVEWQDENGAKLGEVDADPKKGISANNTGLWVKDGVGTKEDGTKFSEQGIEYADGTKFMTNGNIRSSSGVVYNPQGEAVAYEPTGHGSSTGKSADESSAKSDEAKAQAQVSQAESIASSIMAKAASGHATAGDIAHLLSSFEKLGSLVGSLSQMSDPSLMAAAVIAQGEVASTISMAYSSLGHDAGKNHERQVEADAVVAASNGNGTGAQQAAATAPRIPVSTV